MKKLISIVLAVLLISALFGCAAKDSVNGSYDMAPGAPSGGGSKDEADDSYEDGGLKPTTPSGTTNPADTARKRIQYVTVDLETLEFENTVGALKTRTETVGGYIESSRETGRSLYGTGTRQAQLVLRIPTDKLETFEGGIDELGSVLSRYTTTDDVTDKYFDAEARLASLETQRDRYMELLEKADDMEYIIRLTDALTDVIYQIELYTGTLNKYDSLIEYSTVTVNVSEVAELSRAESPTASFGEKIKNAFIGSIDAFVDMCETLTIGLAAALPFLILPAAAVIIIVVAARRRAKKRRREYAAMMAAQQSGGTETK